jgi:hypothetical protein
MTWLDQTVAPLATVAAAGASALAVVTPSQEASLAWVVIAVASFAMTIMGSLLVAQRRAMRTVQDALGEEVSRCGRLEQQLHATREELGVVRHQLAEALELGR